MSDRTMSLADLQVVHIVDNLDRGGLEHVVCDLSIEQMRRGCSVSVYCLHVPGSLAEGLAASGVRVLCGYKRRGPDLRVMLELSRLLRGSRRSLLHAHSMMPNYYACAARLLARLSIVVVNTRHDMGSTRPHDLRERLYRLSVPFTRLAVMVSQGVRDHFVGAGIVPARKARVVMNGIHTDCPQTTQQTQRAAARRRLSMDDEAFIVGCVGRLVELKNHASVVRALARAAAIQPRFRLVLIGGGPLRMELEQLVRDLGVADRVALLGERNDIRELLPGLDLFVMPSLTEGHSIALLEAMAAGCTVIATRVGGNSEVITHDRTGILVPPNDEDALCQAMLRLMDDRAHAARLAAEARAWAVKHVSVAAMTDGYEAIYAEALGPLTKPAAA